MKTLNAKRITAIAAGAALLGLGLAFAGPITFQNVPVITASGQPVVQIVVGSSAQPSDGVAAANIAAAIGNLAFASVPVTASVNQTQAASVLHVTLGTGSSYSLSNQQVWLNETGTTSVSGTYTFGALIGSVLNRAVQLNVPQNTKSEQGTGQYAYPDAGSGNSFSTTLNPGESAYAGVGGAPTNSTPLFNTNGGGVSFPSTFQSSGNDNILQVTSSQLPALMNNAGPNGETESLWVTGFPVFVQQTSSQAGGFALLSAGGAYEATFSKPIQLLTSSGSFANPQITLLGQNWTILGGYSNTKSSSAKAAQNTAVPGGNVTLASSLSPLTTVYVGHNITSGSFTVTLEDLGQPAANGTVPAAINVYYNGVLTNTSSLFPSANAQKFNVTGHILYVHVNQTFAGLYAYQKWAKLQLYSNVFNVKSGQVFNNTYDKGWDALLYWTNTTSSSSGATANALYGIVIYNATPVTMTPGKSLVFIQQPSAWKLTFVGDTLNSANLDPVTLSVTNQQETYQNLGSSGAGSILNITEPSQLLTVTSQIPNAFTSAGPQSSTVIYDLTPYEVNNDANALATLGANTINAAGANTFVTLSYTGDNAANWITSTNPLQVTLYGQEVGSSGGPGPSNQTVSLTGTFSSNSQLIAAGHAMWMLQGDGQNGGIRINRALPPGPLTVSVYTANAANTLSNTLLGTLTSMGQPAVLYTQSGQNYMGTSTTAPGNTLYNFGGSGTFVPFTLTQSAQPTTGPTQQGQYFTYTMNEIDVPNSGTNYQDGVIVGIDNTTAGITSGTMFQLNYSVAGSTGVSGVHNNVTYTSSQGHSINVEQGFRTEAGSKVTSITPGSVTVSFVKAVDMLQFSVGPANVTAVVHHYKLFGPYGVGQATNLPNVSIGAVNASVQVSGAGGASITGIGQIQAVPSVTSASEPVLLKNLSSTAPLVVLDSNANPSSNLILIGSGYVNTLSQQLQSQYGVSITSPSSPVVEQAYGANRILLAGYTAAQTQQAANQFIQALYAQASA